MCSFWATHFEHIVLLFCRQIPENNIYLAGGWGRWLVVEAAQPQVATQNGRPKMGIKYLTLLMGYYKITYMQKKKEENYE